ncbi:MAG: hypothetical protein E7608_03540 [Ruminococcaceae bacterium]|nr:hypothetical protein [Oscillospiraceae bacterium]MBO5005921.1 hypothetical protein [Clostridia bacterium]
MTAKAKVFSSFVMSIVAIVFGCLPGMFSVIALPIAIVALIFSITGGKAMKANGEEYGFITPSLILGIIATSFTAITFFTCGICLACNFYKSVTSFSSLFDIADLLS